MFLVPIKILQAYYVDPLLLVPLSPLRIDVLKLIPILFSDLSLRLVEEPHFSLFPLNFSPKRMPSALFPISD